MSANILGHSAFWVIHRASFAMLCLLNSPVITCHDLLETRLVISPGKRSRHHSAGSDGEVKQVPS